MTRSPAKAGPCVPCEDCPLARLDHFRPFAADELRFVSSFKAGEMTIEPGALILAEGSHSAHLFTVLAGWGFRYKSLEDGRRQILNYVLPGDLVGLQSSLMGEMQHSVEALSKVSLCVFERDRLHRLFRDFPSLAFDITWMAAREERILDENLLSMGRRSALERAAYLIAYMYLRAQAVGLTNGSTLAMPITQVHIADTLGLSTVHTNKTLKRLADRRLIRWRDRCCEVVDVQALLEIAGWDGLSAEPRPYI